MANTDRRLFRPKELFTSQKTERITNTNDEEESTHSNYQEIACICLASTLSDFISILAKRNEDGYHITIEDEYDNRFINYKKNYSLIPTQGEIFDIIRDFNISDENDYEAFWIVERYDFKTLKDITDFITIESEIYPDLNDLFIEHFKQNGYS